MEPASRRPDYIPPDDSIREEEPTFVVQLRQRTLQYELVQANSALPEFDWNSIREVASPSTGLFVPVDLAVRRGWIRIGAQNEYVDPTTGESVSLATAYRMGRLRLATTTTSTTYGETTSPTEFTQPIVLLIERTYFGWRKTQLLSVEDTARGDVLTPAEAHRAGILDVSGSEIRFLDTMSNQFLTIEEAVGRQFIQVVALESGEPSTATDDEDVEDDEPVVTNVYRITHLRPGGRPCPWQSPIDALNLGLFLWESGDIAADWRARPLVRDADNTNELPTLAFVPTRWCSFLTARNAGWVRLVEEPDPTKWIVTHSVHYQEPNSVVISRQINLVAYTTTPTPEYSDDVASGDRFRSDDTYRSEVSPNETLSHLPQQKRSTDFPILRMDEPLIQQETRFQRTEGEIVSQSVHRRHIVRYGVSSNRGPHYSGEQLNLSGSSSPINL